MCYHINMFETLENIITSSKEFKMLCDELKGGKLAKTILLLSKDSQYSFAFAKLLSTLILNGGLKEGRLEKNENYFKAMSLSHPDLKVFPSKDRLLVADSEEIVEESVVKPIFAERKVFIIKNIEQSMEAAQNKLLKTLEEPERNVYFILTSTNINLVLPTIRSRCNKIELGKLGSAELQACLGYCENFELVSVLSEGFIGQAEVLNKMENLPEFFRCVLSLVTKLKSSKELLIYSKALSVYSGHFELIIKTLSLIFEDILFVKVGMPLRFASFKSEIEGVSSDYSVKAITEIRKLIDRAVKEISYNCNFMLVMENLLLNILEVKYLCR